MRNIVEKSKIYGSPRQLTGCSVLSVNFAHLKTMYHKHKINNEFAYAQLYFAVFHPRPLQMLGDPMAPVLDRQNSKWPFWQP